MTVAARDELRSVIDGAAIDLYAEAELDVIVDAILANPDVVLRALGAVKCWHPQGTEKPLVPHWWFPMKEQG